MGLNSVHKLLYILIVLLPSVYCAQPKECLNSLKELLDAAQSSNFSDDVVCVNVPSVDFLNYTDIAVSFNVVLTGNGSEVRCNEPENEDLLNLTVYTHFPLTFSNSNFVSIEDVHFIGCRRPVQFKEITEVRLLSVSFSDFYSAGTVEMSNCPLITVNRCTFTNGTSLGIGTQQYSGNSGGLAIGYNDQPLPPHVQATTPVINITRSSFTYNKAKATERFVHTVSDVISKRVYNERGGAIAVYMGASNYSVDITVNDCTFEENYAQNSGGGIYMFLTGASNAHRVTITETRFIRDKARDGGGLEITFSSPDSVSNPNVVLIRNCNFTENTGTFGGGFKGIQLDTRGNLNKIDILNSTFSANKAPVGAALYLQSLFTLSPIPTEKRINVESCSFYDNVAERGVVFVIKNSVGVLGNTAFKRSTGPALRIVGSIVSLADDITFEDNRHHREGFSGALHLSSYGQLLLESGVNVTFRNNSGIEGAAIVVRGQIIATAFTKQLYNPQCFLQYENSSTAPENWNVKMVFENNSAVAGPVIYASDLDICEWYSRTSPFFSDNNTVVWSFMELGENYIVRRPGKESEYKPDPDYYFQTDVHSIWLPDNQTQIQAFPGESVTLSAVALDEYSHNTSAFLRLGTTGVTVEPSIIQSVAGVGNITFTYSSNSTEGAITVDINAPFVDDSVPSVNFTIQKTPCQPGYFLHNNRCVCNETDIVSLCNPDRRGVLLRLGLWGAPPNWSSVLVAYTCPAGYCNCTRSFAQSEENVSTIDVGCLLNYNDPYAICHSTRTGLLCGECKKSYGVGLLTNVCRKFTDKIPQFYWLVPLYIGILIPLLVAIVKSGFHLPTILRGFIFYCQISPIAAQYLPGSFRLNVEVMACIGSALALYVPYDFSFHSEMPSLESYGLRYVTPLIALIVVPIATRVRRHRSKYWHGVWTVILLLYVMIVQTSVSILFCPKLIQRTRTGDSNSLMLWFFDGSVTCYRGWHLFLVLIAITVLILLALLVPFVAVSIYFKQLRKKFQSFERLERFSLALTHGFKEECKWWPVVELGCRYVLVVTITASAGNTVIPLVLSIMVFVVQFFVHPYEDKKANYCESLVNLMLVIMLALGNTTLLIETVRNVQRFTLWPLYYLPVASGAVVVVALVMYKIWKFISARKDAFKTAYKKKKSKKSQGSFFRTLSISYAYQRSWLAAINNKNFTRTVVTIEEEGENDEIELSKVKDDDDDDDYFVDRSEFLGNSTV